MKEWTKNQLRRVRIFTIINSDSRNKYLKKHHIFKEMGENVFFSASGYSIRSQIN